MNDLMSCGRLGGLLLAVLVAAAGCEDKHPSPVATPPPVVAVAFPLERVVTDYEVWTARTQAVQSVNIRARATGFLMELGFQDGKEVTKGQVLFKIDPRPYQDQLDIAKGNVARLVGQQKLIKVQVDRYTNLVAKGAASQQDLDVYHGQYAENVGALEAARAQVKYAELNLSFCSVTAPIAGRIDRHFLDVGELVSQDTTLLTNIVSLKPTWAYFNVDQNTARRYEDLVRTGKVKSARTAELDLPVLGASTMGLLGSSLGQGPFLAASALISGRASEIPVRLGLGNDRTFPIEGVIDFVSNQLDPSTGSIALRAVFPNTDGKLMAGLFGRIQVPVSAPHPALLVRDEAIGTNQGEKYVLVVNEQDVVDYHPVTVGQVHHGLREVLPERQLADTDASGNPIVRHVKVLSVTDRVIVAGLQRVRPGAVVSPKLTDMLTQLPAQPGAAK